MGVELAGAITGAAAGSLLGGGGSSNQNQLMEQFNKILNKALDNAIGTSTQYTNQAVNQQNKSLGIATSELQKARDEAIKSLFGTTNQAFNLGQGLLSPYRNAGYAGNDAYLQSLGLSTPQGGSQNQANQNALQQQIQLLNQQYGGQAPQSITLGAAPDLNQIKSSLSSQSLHEYLTKNQSKAGGGVGNTVTINGKVYTQPSKGGWTSAQIQAMQADLQTQAAQQQYQQQQQAYQTQQQQAKTYQDYQNQVQQLQQQYPNSPQNQAPQAPQNPNITGQNQGLSNFLNNPMYQALFGSGAAQQMAADGTYDPTQAFANDPGTQYAIEQALKAVNQQGAAKGLLESGPLQQELLRTAQGIQNQGYQNYQGQLAGVFGQYQNQLAGLTQLGSGLTGANTAASLFGNAAQLQNQNIYGTGTQLANANLQTGGNISELFANQGVLNANAYLNTGAAQANGLMNNAAMNAQMSAANMASNAQTNSAAQNNQGFMNAAGLFGYNANQPQNSSLFSGNQFRQGGTY